MATRNSQDTAGRRERRADLYSVLGVKRDATTDQIKKAYRKLARKFHPDVNPGDRTAEEHFKEVSLAHDVLGDEAKRKLYDEFGDDSRQAGFDAERARELRRWQNAARMRGGGGTEGWEAGGFAGAAPGGFDGARGRRARSGRFGGFEDLFGGFFSQGMDGAERGADAEVPVAIELLEAIRGATRAISVRRPENCPVCAGSGVEPTADRRTPCRRCGGTGTVEETTRLNVKIPPGVESGSRVRVPGKGGAGSGGGPAGDLYVVVEVRPHPWLKREGKDLILDVPITVSEALLGASVTVPTPDGNISLKVPPGTQSGKQFRVPGKGVPDLRGGKRGDLYVRAMIHVPEGSEATRQAAKALDDFYPSSPRRDLRL